MTQWSPQQDDALVAVDRWLNDRRGKQVFRLFGYAGTGKTTLARHLAEGVGGKVCFGAFTGKAALVMKQKGCHGARTIHSMIYEIDDEATVGEQPAFTINLGSEVVGSKLVIIDECSMVGEDLARDLLSFGKKVLVLGDPAQLPPVSGAGVFTEAQPDVMLTEVHRQAADNPIINLSIAIREGRGLQLGEYGESRVIDRHDLDTAEVMAADQVLVGRNHTRRKYNGRMRQLLERDAEKPEIGDRLICLRNDKKKRLLNGGMWQVAAKPTLRRKRPIFKMKVVSDDFGGRSSERDIEVRREFFEGVGAELPWAERMGTDEFDYAYAITTHKAQGSQWSNVMVFDESSAFRENRERWLYTAVTRAAEKVTVVQ